MGELQGLIDQVNQFRDDRNWRKFHNPKDLAISISIEASELLEDFQWKDSEQALTENRDNIQDEIADVLIYTLMLCSDLDLDVKEIIEDKMNKNSQKYPVSK